MARTRVWNTRSVDVMQDADQDQSGQQSAEDVPGKSGQNVSPPQYRSKSGMHFQGMHLADPPLGQYRVLD